ncbi:ribonuclease H-like domain-containing protein [Tanacetum coccineum]
MSKTLQQRLVENPQSAKEAWDILADIFHDNKRTRSIALKGELRSLKLEDLSIDAYFCKIESIATVLTSLGSPMNSDDVVTFALEGLPAKYDNFQCSAFFVIHGKANDMHTLQHLLSKLGCHGNTSNVPTVGQTNMATNGTSPSLIALQTSHQVPSSGYALTHDLPGHMGQPVQTGLTGQQGATSHLNDYVNNLSDIINSSIYSSVAVGDEHSIPVTNFGHSILSKPFRPLHSLILLVFLLRTSKIIECCSAVIALDLSTLLRSLLPFLKSISSVSTRGINVLDIQEVKCQYCSLYVVISPQVFSQWTVSRYKARLVANGSTQIEGIYVDETFSPVVKPGTIRTVLSLALSQHWSVHQLDVKNAFLHGDLAETVYMHQPPGFQDPAHPDHVCLLRRSLYDLKHAPRAWFQRISAYITRVGFSHSRFTRDSKGMFLSHRKYATEILERAHRIGCNPSRTPVDTESKLGDDGDPVADPTVYKSLAGSLQYLTFTRPDISYVVQQLFSSSTTSLVAYSDVDWAGCPTTRRSTSGYCVFLGNNLLSWSSKRQPTLSRSSAEAEYRGVVNAVAETCWLRNLLRELHTPLSSTTLIYCDNVSVVYVSSNPVQHQRTKHIEIDIHFVRDLAAAGEVRVLHVPSRYQYADVFTKGLPTTLFEEFCSILSVWCPPAQTAGQC